MLSSSQVEEHNSRDSCWIIIQGQVYDVTDFLDEHPGGASIILRHAGKDATDEYMPVHPPGTIEKELTLDKHLGKLDPNSISNDKKVRNHTLQRDILDASSNAVPIELCLCLDDFERAAKSVTTQRARTYYSSASESLHSQRMNRDDWGRIVFRPRVLRNVQRVDMGCRILGHDCNLPFFIAPAALGRLGHPDGELCLARGAGRRNIPYAVSAASSVSAEELVQCIQEETVNGCLFYQLYVKKQKAETVSLIRRARYLGFKALLVSVDTPVVGKREEDDRYKAQMALQAAEPTTSLSITGSPDRITSSPPSDGVPVFRGPYSSTLNWEDLRWIREEWGDDGTICLKGIATAEDAKIACDCGIKCIYLSNHGGRQLDSAPSAMRTLLEIRKFYPEVFANCEILVDGGARRATDILKALCLGAKGVGLGRPFMYALSAYGTEGVLKAIQIISDELETSMRLLGVTNLDQLGPHLVNTRDLDAKLMLEIPAVSSEKSRL